MKTHRRRSLPVLGLLVAALVLGGCGGGDDGQVAEPASGAENPATDGVEEADGQAGDQGGVNATGSQATIVVGDMTFEVAASNANPTCASFMDGGIFSAAWMDVDQGLVFRADLSDDHVTISLDDDVEFAGEPGFVWHADGSRSLGAAGEDPSGVDSYEQSATSLSGTATFIDTVQAFQGTIEPVEGTFDIQCAS